MPAKVGCWVTTFAFYIGRCDLHYTGGVSLFFFFLLFILNFFGRGEKETGRGLELDEFSCPEIFILSPPCESPIGTMEMPFGALPVLLF